MTSAGWWHVCVERGMGWTLPATTTYAQGFG